MYACFSRNNESLYGGCDPQGQVRFDIQGSRPSAEIPIIHSSSSCDNIQHSAVVLHNLRCLSDQILFSESCLVPYY